MQQGLITVRGVVQGVGFRPYVYAEAVRLGLSGTVKNLGSEVEVRAAGERFDELVASLRRGPPLSRIDSVEVSPLAGRVPAGFAILPSAEGARTGLIPPDVATCGRCLSDIDDPASRYSRVLGDIVRRLRPPVQHHPRPALRPPPDLDGRVPALRRLPDRVHGPGLAPAPRPDDRLPGLRPAPDALRRGRPARPHGRPDRERRPRSSTRSGSWRSRGSAGSTSPASRRRPAGSRSGSAGSSSRSP